MELKKPRKYEDAVQVAKNKEWKLKRLSQLGVDPSYKSPKMMQIVPIHGHAS